MANIMLDMLLQLLLMLLEQHLYLWLFHLKGFHYMLLHRLLLQPRANLTIFIRQQICYQSSLWACHRSNMVSLYPGKIKLKISLMFRNYWIQYHYLSCQLLLRLWGILKLTLQKLREITLISFLQGMLPLKERAAAKSVSWSKGLFPQMITFKN